ncbi:MAG: sigma-54 dependent transcriptional regulator [Planctomycetes bacterium]|nr:sigma-54 dependent transcriptional regulator [Planctomycetota bacterium]
MAERVRVLVVDDEERMRSFLVAELARLGFSAEEAGSGEEALRRVEERDFDVVLLDLRMEGMTGLEALARFKAADPSPEVIILTGHGTIDTAIEAMRVGAYHYLTKPFKLRDLEIHVRKAHERTVLLRRSRRLLRLVRARIGGAGIVGGSTAMKRVLDLVAKVAPTESAVLVTGESGTGKELVATAIHNLSSRSGFPFVAVNCGALQESLLESELFGHEKGAFTGAHRAKEGLFEVAHQGTLFLDEIGELSPALQVKLLRAIESGEIRRLGGTRAFTVDVRTVSATNVDLREAVRTGRFREDLFYRLSIFPIEVPPLRDRPEDVRDLVLHFLATVTVPGKGPFTIAEEALDALTRYRWPGNVRELRNTVERMMILSEGSTLDLTSVPPEVRAPGPAAIPAPEEVDLTLDEVERRHILAVLARAGGNKTRAAAILGVTTRTLYNKLAEYGVSS